MPSPEPIRQKVHHLFTKKRRSARWIARQLALPLGEVFDIALGPEPQPPPPKPKVVRLKLVPPEPSCCTDRELCDRHAALLERLRASA